MSTTDMGGMMGMGMDMGSDGMFRGTNIHIARIYWYLIAATVALLTVRRCIEWGRSRIALLVYKQRSSTIPSRPENILSQAYDTLTAMCREIAYPQIYWLSGPFSKYLNPPPLGRCLLILAYWGLVLVCLWTNTILTPSSQNYAYKWEIVGFRAAWVSVTQLPLIYCLGCKINIVSFLTGISYERLNWLHRWIARTLFLTVIVHWSFFFREWWIADFTKLELEMMPMVKFGFGAWSVLGWMVITGFGFFRQLSYEFFVLQHVVSFTVLLWLVYSHVPSYAQYNVWLAIGCIVLDRGGRTLLLFIQNVHIRTNSSLRKRRYAVGFSAKVTSLPDDYVAIIIEDVNFSWQAGQHVFISIPRCGLFQSHPFTMAGLPGSGNVRIILKAHSGFTRRLLEFSRQQPNQTLRTLISSPYGSPPLHIMERSDSLILMATSTGASFIVPILHHTINKATSVRRVCFYWIVRNPSHLDWFQSDIVPVLQKAKSRGIKVWAQVFVTQEPSLDIPVRGSDASLSTASPDCNSLQGEKRNLTQETALLPSLDKAEGTRLALVGFQKSESMNSLSIDTFSDEFNRNPTFSILPVTYGRPSSLDALIRPTVEDSEGETAIIACGGAAFLAELRNYTAALSDERAVHKGTGAQGIYLFTESYGW